MRAEQIRHVQDTPAGCRRIGRLEFVIPVVRLSNAVSSMWLKRTCFRSARNPDSGRSASVAGVELDGNQAAFDECLHVFPDHSVHSQQARSGDVGGQLGTAQARRRRPSELPWFCCPRAREPAHALPARRRRSRRPRHLPPADDVVSCVRAACRCSIRYGPSSDPRVFRYRSGNCGVRSWRGWQRPDRSNACPIFTDRGVGGQSMPWLQLRD